MREFIYKYECYNVDPKSNTIILELRASNEDEAIKIAQEMADRDVYKLISVK